MTRIFTAILLALGLSGCSKWDLDTEWKSGPFRLITIDARSEMHLVHEESGILVRPTIFAIGADEKHIVLMQHPPREAGTTNFDRAITHYFVVSRDKTIRGPLTKEEFDALRASLDLPPFTKVFSDLK